MSIMGCEDRIPSDMLANTHKQLTDDSRKAFVRHYRLFNYLINNGLNPNTVCQHDAETAVHAFIKKADLRHVEGGYARILDMCIAKGFDINAVNEYGQTILHVACADGNLLAVQCILSRGANINAVDKSGRTALHHAAVNTSDIIPHGNPLTAAYLIEQGANPDQADYAGNKPIDRARKAYSGWMDSSSFKSWNYKTQSEYREEIEEISRSMNAAMSKKKYSPQEEKRDLSTSTSTMLSSLGQNGLYSNEMKEYVESFNRKRSGNHISLTS